MHITNKISQIFDKFASTKFSAPIQEIINNGYVKFLGLDMSEFKQPSYYKTLNELFTRKLVVPRVVDKDLNSFISPADSLVSAQGDIDKNIALQVKGMSYSVDELLTLHITEKNRHKLYGGKFMNFYLSPKDYHRYHSPHQAQVLKLIHIPGKLYPVNFKYLNKQESLFIHNERVVMECKTSNDKLFYMVFVGALNVGKMVFEFEPKISTNTLCQKKKIYKYDNLYINKGDCLGYFKMGSTVLMFWEKDMVELEKLAMNNIRFTQTIANIKE